jgi:hypothetical protein
VSLVGCSPSDRSGDQLDAPPAPDIDAPPAVDNSRVYAHSGGMLYRLNNLSLAAVPIGPLAGIGTQNLLDLAVDKDDKISGITRDTLYTIDVATGAATLVRDLDQTARGFTSLSYAPKVFSDPASPDILVSANDQGDVFEISPTTGIAVKIGSYGTTAVGKVISSGDLIAVRGVGIFATVDVGTETTDYLAKIDPITWKATPLGTGTGFDKIFGLGFWGGRIYGFVDDGFAAGTGKIVQLDPNTGAGLLISSAPIRWFGAGVATDAPIFQ